MDRRRFLPAYHYADNTSGNLTKSVGKPLRDYKIYGESVQNGTPSPEAPVEIMSVGEKTINLSPINDIRKQSTSRWSYQNLGKLELVPGKYTVKCHYKQYGTPTKVQISVRDYDELNTAYGYSVYYGLVEDDALVSFTLPTTAKGIQIILYINATADAIDADCEFTNIMLVKGTYTMDIMPEYEPFGYKVPIKVIGKNLYDAETHFNAVCEYETLKGYEPTKGVIDGVECYQYWGRNFSGTNETNPSKVIRCNFKEKTPYTVSTDWYDIFYTNPSTGITNKGLGITFVYTDGTTSAFIPNASVRVENKWMHYTQTSYMGRSLDYIEISFGTGAAHTYLANFQIEEGTSETTYEPYKVLGTNNIYLAEPLRKIGEYADYIDYRNGCVVRNTQHVILDSSLNYTLVDMMLKVDCLEEQGTGLQGLCTCSPINTALMPGYMYLGENNNTVVVWVLRPSDLSGIAKNIDTFKAWLDSQTIPLEIVCERPTPLIESITLPTMLLNKGTLHISVDTKEIKPSSAVWQYYKK